MAKKENKWNVVVFVIVTLWIMAYLFSGIVELSVDENNGDGNVALIKIDKVIVGGEGIFGKSSISSSEIIKFIDAAEKNENVKAIVFEINSPGGSALASKEIADAIKKVNKSTISLIREIGTSGAYWSASATDYIVADELSITGSIGVIASYLEFTELFEKYGINYRRMVAGKYKDIGSPLKNLTVEEEVILQKQLDKIHDFFIKEVANNRKLKVEDVREISTGEFYLGEEAVSLGLVDELGNMDKVEEILKQRMDLDKVKFIEYKRRKGFLDSVFDSVSQQSYSVGRGIGEGILNKDKSVVMT